MKTWQKYRNLVNTHEIKEFKTLSSALQAKFQISGTRKILKSDTFLPVYLFIIALYFCIVLNEHIAKNEHFPEKQNSFQRKTFSIIISHTNNAQKRSKVIPIKTSKGNFLKSFL